MPWRPCLQEIHGQRKARNPRWKLFLIFAPFFRLRKKSRGGLIRVARKITTNAKVLGTSPLLPRSLSRTPYLWSSSRNLQAGPELLSPVRPCRGSEGMVPAVVVGVVYV
jgi:hypothetical protein